VSLPRSSLKEFERQRLHGTIDIGEGAFLNNDPLNIERLTRVNENIRIGDDIDEDENEEDSEDEEEEEDALELRKAQALVFAGQSKDKQQVHKRTEDEDLFQPV